MHMGMNVSVCGNVHNAQQTNGSRIRSLCYACVGFICDPKPVSSRSSPAMIFDSLPPTPRNSFEFVERKLTLDGSTLGE